MDRIVFDKPEVIVRKKKDPKVIIIEEKAADKPAVQPEKKPVVEVIETEPEAEPAPVVEADRRPGAGGQTPGYRSPQLQRPHCTGANRDAAR